MADEQGSTVTGVPLRSFASGFRGLWRRLRRSDVAPRVAPPAAEWRARLQSRLLVCAVLFGLWTAAIEARLFYLQVLEKDELTAYADRQQLRTIASPAKRGEILDRNGRVLAYSVDADSVFADPSEIENAAGTAAAVCGAIDGCEAADRQSMEKQLHRDTRFVYLARRVSPDEARRVRDLHLRGVGFVKENRRYYPKKELAAHVLGYVGTENVGLGGLESAYDSQIRGRDGRVLIQVDAKRDAMFSRVERPPRLASASSSPSIRIPQYIAEREAPRGVANRAPPGAAWS